MYAALRWIAIAIAIGGVIDPAIASTRRSKPEIAVVAADPSVDAGTVADVIDALDGDFTVIAGRYPAASATVLVGSAMPASVRDINPPVFAVVPEPIRPSFAVERLSAPARASLDARVPVTIGVRTTGAVGQTLETTVRFGSVVVDRLTRTVEGDDEVIEFPLSFVPTDTGVTRLRVGVTMRGVRDPATIDVPIDIRTDAWTVLFFDPRPSWMSTFVRRGVERDPRFVVASRIVTSRNVSTDAGRPPPGLTDGDALATFNAIVVGGADALTSAEVAGLERYLRRHGGSVVLLLDQRAGGAFERLIGVNAWDRASTGAGLVVASSTTDSTAGLRASEIVWPRILPPGSDLLAVASPSSSASTTARPVVWRSAVGAGRIVVSGALDAWRFRDPATSGFETFWRTIVADAAAAGGRNVDIVVDPTVVRPGEPFSVRATVRGVALASLDAARPLRTSVAATLAGSPGSESVRLWPTGAVGEFAGTVRAPRTPGAYRIVVSADGARAHVPIVVGESVGRPTLDERDLSRAWLASRGGSVFPANRLRELAATLDRTVRPVPRRETWYPMRSPWWLVPFTLALGLEWWWRRRRGLR